MIRCPKCHAAIQESREFCQFCGTDVTNVRRRVSWDKSSDPTAATWAWYTVLSIALTIAGGSLVAMAAGALDRSASLATAVAGAAAFSIGFGFLVRIQLFRAHAQALCFLAFAAGVIAVIEGFVQASSSQLSLWLCVAGAAVSLVAGMLPGYAGRTITTWVR